MVVTLLLGIVCVATAAFLSIGVVADAAARRGGLDARPTRLRPAAVGFGVVGLALLGLVIVTMT